MCCRMYDLHGSKVDIRKHNAIVIGYFVNDANYFVLSRINFMYKYLEKNTDRNSFDLEA